LNVNISYIALDVANAPEYYKRQRNKAEYISSSQKERAREKPKLSPFVFQKPQFAHQSGAKPLVRGPRVEVYHTRRFRVHNLA